MLFIRLLWAGLCLCWIAAEIRLARRNKIGRNNLVELETHSQRLLWLTLLSGFCLALFFKSLALMPILIAYLPRQLFAMVIFSTGLAVRYSAVKTLGRLFTTDVAIHSRHTLITTGPYRLVRHPAYSGLIIALIGAGMAMGDFLALLLLTLPALFAFNYRINLEEKMLEKKFGESYLSYRNRTKKILPWLF